MSATSRFVNHHTFRNMTGRYCPVQEAVREQWAAVLTAMSDTGSFRIPAGLLRPSPVGDTGSVEFDDLGKAVWTPRANLDEAEALRRLLNHPSLTIVPDAPGSQQRIAPNPAGLRAGYDPYESGQLEKNRWRARKDLRRLSDWIVRNRKPDPDGDR